MKVTDLKLKESNKKQSNAAYLPSLSFSAYYNYNAMTKKLDFFQSDDNWYSSSAISVKLSVPIFDGLQKQSRVAQAKLNVQKSKENLQLAEQAIKLDIANYVTVLKNTIDNMNNEKDNLDLAQSVYTETQLQYRQGMATSLDLVQSESSLREAQNNYYNKLLDFYIARINLEKSKGTLLKFINNQL
jgi:outer membrane protein TolC